jgi:hypothetical protein
MNPMFAFTGVTLTGLLHEGASTVIYRGYRETTHDKVIIKTHRGDFPKATLQAGIAFAMKSVGPAVASSW